MGILLNDNKYIGITCFKSSGYSSQSKIVTGYVALELITNSICYINNSGTLLRFNKMPIILFIN
jgi:hypothetical protein